MKVKLSLLLLYDGKTAVFSGECGSFFTFWDKKQRGKMYVKNTDAGWRKNEQKKQMLVTLAKNEDILVIL